MKKSVLFWGVILLLLLAGIGSYIWWQPESVGIRPGPIVQPSNFTFSGPYVCDNLTIFLIHGEDRLGDRKFVTLQEGLESGQVVVHETSSVNELAVENLSPSEELFIQSGDIVKGGKQDRALHYDLVAAPQSGRQPLASFCVESGRWSGRSGEKIGLFSSSSHSLSTKELKLATKYKKNQQEVWAKVADAQAKLERNLNSEVKSAESASSLQLTLESTALQQAIAPFLASLAKIIEGKNDVIGFAYGVNGTVSGAEVYGSRDLFRKLWPKLLQANAVEAVAERKKDAEFAPVSLKAVRECLLDAEKGSATVQDVNDRVQVVVQESSRNLLFKTRDRSRKGEWLHRTYLTKPRE